VDTTYADFLKKYPTYAGTAKIDELRAADYSRLDRAEHIYLDCRHALR